MKAAALVTALAMACPGMALYASAERAPADGRGDASAGRDLFVSREGGHCILCHRVAGLDAPFQGDVGPELTGIGSRRAAAEIRAFIMDPTRINPEAAMPAYFRTDDLRQVAADRRGKTVLTAEQIDDIVAFLLTLEDAP